MLQRNAVPRSGATAQPTTASSSAAPRGGTPGFKSGAAARQKTEVVLAQQSDAQEIRGHGLDLSIINSYRFRMQEGEEADIIVLDATLDNADPRGGAIFADEHHMKDAQGRYSVFEFCPKEYDNCCLCEGIDNRVSSYTMFLTVLDLRGIQRRDQPFEDRIKRLMAVKTQLHPEFFKLHDACVREHGTMRGMVLLMARDGTINSSIGHPIMLNNGKMFDFLSEQELQEQFGHGELREEPEVEGQLGRLVKAENYDIQPFQYHRIFKAPTGIDLRTRYGAGSTAPMGSTDDTRAGWQGSEQRSNNAGAPRMRTRSAMGDQPSAPAQEQAASPHAAPGTVPRTRSRTVIEAPRTSTPVTAATAPAPAAPARERVRTAPAQPTAPATAPVTAGPKKFVRRAAPGGAVANDLNSDIPF